VKQQFPQFKPVETHAELLQENQEGDRRLKAWFPRLIGQVRGS